ncbi:MAG: DUF2304 domain-containing protein [Microlunatus sp.]
MQIMIIKPLLILCFVILLVFVFRQRSRAGLRAGSRIAALALAIAAIAFVLDPDIPQALAEFVGVGRGTDLVLYILVVVFAVTSMSLYFGQRAMQVQVQQLARRLAISDAVATDGPPRPKGEFVASLPVPRDIEGDTGDCSVAKHLLPGPHDDDR